MITITDKSDYVGLTSLRRFKCPNCKTMISFRMIPQVACYNCGYSLLDVTDLLKNVDTRLLYHKTIQKKDTKC